MLLKVILLAFLNSIAFSQQLEHLAFKDCNFTDYRFQSKYNLGKQDQLNNTFDAMVQKISINDVIYPVNSYTNYTLKGIKTNFSYLDSTQKAQIIGNDTIAIDGGFLQTYLTMTWSKKDLFNEINGTLQASCKSDKILFSKNLTIQKGYLLYQVEQYYNITFKDELCKIVRYQPSNTSDYDLNFVSQMLNNRSDEKQTARSQLAQAINKNYLYYLNLSLYNQRHQLDDKFIYEWNDQSKDKKMQVEFQVVPTGVDLETIGLSFTFVTEIKDYDKWQCGATIPRKNLDVNKYGGIQQFVSLSIFQNTIRYGAEAGALDTVLNRVNWSSRMFQFFAGDLYEVIPSISEKYMARQEVTGSCRASPQNISIVPQQKINQLVVRTGHVCYLYIKQTTKILELDIDLFAQVEAKFEEQAKVNFYLKGFTHSISYREQPNFKINDYSLANSLVLSTLNKLLQTKTFGSGWPIFDMDYPHVKVMGGGYVVFYDTSHIESTLNAE